MKNLWKDPMYKSERSEGPRFIPSGTFDYKFCEKYKQLSDLRLGKETVLSQINKETTTYS